MNVTTRLLEVEGNKGKGLHPFQILFARMSITVFLASLYVKRSATGASRGEPGSKLKLQTLPLGMAFLQNAIVSMKFLTAKEVANFTFRYMLYMKTPHFPFGLPEVRLLLVARGFGGFFGVFGMYYSLLYLPLSDATVITFLAPGLACWACSFLIEEPFTKIEKIGTLVSLVRD